MRGLPLRGLPLRVGLEKEESRTDGLISPQKGIWAIPTEISALLGPQSRYNFQGWL